MRACARFVVGAFGQKQQQLAIGRTAGERKLAVPSLAPITFLDLEDPGLIAPRRKSRTSCLVRALRDPQYTVRSC